MRYYLVTYFGELWMLFLVFLLFIGVFCALGGERARWKDLISHRYYFLKGKFWLYIIVFCVLVLCGAMNLRKIPFKGDAVISFNYDGASNGLNPNSTRFNQTDMLSDEVLERVIHLGQFTDITADDLREVLEIVPKEKGAGSGESYRVSTEYSVKYRANKKWSKQDGKSVLDLFCGIYREWFIDQYSYSEDSLQTNFELIDSEDYLDMCDYYDMVAEQISEYMSSMARREATFVSSSTGESFQTISKKASNVKKSLIQDLRVFVLDHGLSKDSVTYMGRLEIENVMLTFDALKFAKANANRLTAIQKYEDDMARIVLVPTYDLDGQFYMSQTKIGIDGFAEEAEDYASQKTSVSSDITYNDYIFRQMENGGSSTAVVEKAELQINKIEEELSAIAAAAKASIREYASEQANGYMTVDIQSEEKQIAEAWQDAVRKTLAFWIVSNLVLFLFEVKREKSMRRNRK